MQDTPEIPKFEIPEDSDQLASEKTEVSDRQGRDESEPDKEKREAEKDRRKVEIEQAEQVQEEKDEKKIEEIRADLKAKAEDKYESQDRKRFVLSKEDFAQERMSVVKQVVDQARSEDPRVLSLTLYGSMIRGTANEASDIDGYLYVDAQGKETSINDSRYIFDETTQRHYENLIRQPLIEKANLSDEQVKHLRVSPISREIIDDQVEQLGGYLSQLRIYQNKQEERNTYLDSPNADFSQAPESLEHPGVPPVLGNVSGMFHLGVGKGVEGYRGYLIDKLKSMGDKGDAAWRNIIESTEMSEQFMHTDTNKRYPRTLDEAEKVYGNN